VNIIANSIPLTNITTGIGRYMRNLYQAIGEIETIHPWFFNGSGPTQTMSSIVNAKVWVKIISLIWKLPDPLVFVLRSLQWLYFEKRLRAVCQRQSFDIYHETAFIPAAVRDIPIVYTIHDMSLIHYRDKHPRERVWFFNFFYKRRIQYATHILTVSEFSRSEIVRYLGLDPARVTAIPLAADPVFSPRPMERVQSLLKENGWPDQYILFVGSLEPRKNLGALVQAIQKTRTQLPVLLAGWQGWGDKTWIDVIRREGLLNRFIFTGYVSDETLACLYSGASVLVYPSLYEGFGLPILEAMACGCPVICSNVSSMPEVAGDAAWLVNPEDACDIATAIDRVVADSDIRRSLIRKGFKRSAEFSWPQTAIKTMALFDTLIASKEK